MLFQRPFDKSKIGYRAIINQILALTCQQLSPHSTEIRCSSLMKCSSGKRTRLWHWLRNKRKRLYGFEANISSSINILFLKRFFRRNIQNSWFKNITRSLMHCRGQFIKKNHNFYREETNLFKYIIISFSKEFFDSRIMKRLQNVAEFFKHLLNWILFSF